MAHVIVLGAGLGGTIMAYELNATSSAKEHKVSVVTNGSNYSFCAFQSVGRRRLARSPVGRGRPDTGHGAAQVNRLASARHQKSVSIRPSAQRIEPTTAPAISGTTIWSSLPDPTRLRRVEGLGPEANPVDLPHRPARSQPSRSTRCKNPGPVVVGAVQGASCFGPAYEFAFILDNRAATPQGPRPRADDLRHLGTLYRASRPRRRRRHQGAARERDARASHQVDHQRPGDRVEPGKMFVEEIAEDGAVRPR